MAETTNLMAIGRFSALSRISVRMLRHYDAHGVLIPADIDQTSGYRSYTPDQLADAADIRNLRDVGFGVSAIGVLLAARGTPAWTNALRVQRESLVDDLRAAHGRVSLISRLLEQGEFAMSIIISRTTIPAMRVVTLRGTVPTYANEGQLWEVMMPQLAASGITPTGACGVIEHDDEYTQRDVDLSIFAPVASGTEADSPLEVIDLPARECIVARVIGPYTQISQAHDLINERLASDNLQPLSDGTIASKAFNRYLTTADEVDESELVTEVCLPVA